MAGADAGAKRTVTDLLRQFGWDRRNVVDLGGIITARGTGMYLPIWLSIMQVVGCTDDNIDMRA